MDQHWWKRTTRQRTEWDEKDAVVVFKKPDGSYSFPAINTKQCPEGWEKIVARSDHEVAAIERASNTLNESRWFDRGSGNGHDTQSLPELPFRVR